MKNLEKMTLEFNVHKISSAIENLRYSLIYNEIDYCSVKHYIIKLNEVIHDYYNEYLTDEKALQNNK